MAAAVPFEASGASYTLKVELKYKLAKEFDIIAVMGANNGRHHAMIGSFYTIFGGKNRHKSEHS